MAGSMDSSLDYHCGESCPFCLSTANTDDRKPVPGEDLTGWLYGDKGYISEKLAGWLMNLVTEKT